MSSINRLAAWSVDPDDYPSLTPLPEKLRFLLRYAILAPSSHNTEPWKFRIRDNQIDLLLDYSRWLKVADDDQREMHISIGCALENLLVAADRFEIGHQTILLPSADDPTIAATVACFERRGGEQKSSAGLDYSGHRPSSLFDMLTVRHTNHQPYQQRPIPDDILQQLQNVCIEEGVVLQLTDDARLKQKVDDLVVRADALEFADPAFREELAWWISQGAFGSGWLMSKIGKLAVSYIDLGSSTAKKDTEVLMSSPILGLISTSADDRRSQIQVGQVYQRLSLLAASFGIWCQPMSQIVQIPELKSELSTLAGRPELVPQHPFRMGYAEAETHHTPRRPLDQMLV